MFWKRQEPTELQQTAQKFRRVFSSQEAFDTLCIQAILCKWLDRLDTQEDVDRHNVFVHYLAYFGGKKGDFGFTEKQVRAALRAFIDVHPVPKEMKGVPTDVRR